MRFFLPAENPPLVLVALLKVRFPAGFPSPAADYVETRIDLNKMLIKHPSFTFFAYAEGDSMFPLIQDGNLLVVDRKAKQPNGCVVLASVNNTFCVKRLFKFPDGSIELRSENPARESIHLPSEFEGEFEIFGRVIKAIQDLEK
ncbi:MAG: S24 family peptidase [Pyrinomonadaceae bacterium]